MAFTWNRRKSVRYLWSSLVILTVVACGAFIGISLLFGPDYHSIVQKLKFSGRSERLTEEKCIPICDSRECVQHSNLLLNQVKNAVDPCENFFDFACGKYIDKYWNENRLLVSDMMLKLKIFLKDLLENMDENPDSAKGKLKTVYNSCMKESSSDFQAIPTVLKYLSRFGIPNWPNLNFDFKFTQQSLIDVLSNFLTYKEYGFVEIRFDNFDDAPTEVITTITVPESAYEKKENSSRKYMMKRVLQYFNIDSEEMNQIWEESEAINDAISHLEEENNRIHNDTDEDEITVDCQKSYESEWKMMCNILESFVETAEVGVTVSKRYFIVAGKTYYLQNIIPLLNNFSDRGIANYLALNLLFQHLDELNFYFKLKNQKDSDFFEGFFEYPKADKWQHCMEWLVNTMFVPFGYVYMQTIFTEPFMQEVDDLIGEILNQTADAISNQKWMSEAVRMAFGDQTRNIPYYGYKNHLEANETVLDRAYIQFHPSKDSFLQNVLEYQKFSKVDEMLSILKKANLDTIRETVLKPQATGYAWGFVIFPGFFLPPVFRTGLQRLINLVSLTMIVSHEIGHAFYFASSELEERVPAVFEHREKIIRCVENQYSQFKYETIEKNINGSQHIIEDYADTVAISIAEKIIDSYNSEEDAFLLPGFPYSMKQLLYISAAQVWCGAFSKRAEEEDFINGFHSLGRYRILGMMQNSKGFSKAFSCPEGSFMNPTTKCLFPEKYL